jgi:hypothetical protein
MFMTADVGDRDLKKIEYSNLLEIEGEPVDK